MNTPARDHARPTWSISQAAKYCGTSRTSIQRAIKAGKLPNAEQENTSWRIPIDDLISAGFTPDKIGEQPLHATMHANQIAHAQPDQELIDLRDQLQQEKNRRELAEQARDQAQEQIQLLTNNLSDLRTTLRMLEASPETSSPSYPDADLRDIRAPAKAKKRWWQRSRPAD